MPSAVRLSGDDRLTIDGDVAPRSVDDIEAAASPLADAELRFAISRRDDPRDLPGHGVANEIEAEARPMSQVGTVNDVDHRDDVAARSIAQQRDPRDEYAAGKHDPEERQQRLHEPRAFEG